MLTRTGTDICCENKKADGDNNAKKKTHCKKYFILVFPVAIILLNNIICIQQKLIELSDRLLVPACDHS